jgi:hypothetical protein
VSAPHPPHPTSRLVVAVCAVLAGLLTAVVLVVGAVGFWEWATSPILPVPASTAVCPVDGCGPR